MTNINNDPLRIIQLGSEFNLLRSLSECFM